MCVFLECFSLWKMVMTSNRLISYLKTTESVNKHAIYWASISHALYSKDTKTKENKVFCPQGTHSLKGEKEWLHVTAMTYGESSNRGLYKILR